MSMMTSSPFCTMILLECRSKWTQVPASGSDFVTAPLMSPLFGKTLAVQVQAALQATGTQEVWEFGAGTGALALQLLAHPATSVINRKAALRGAGAADAEGRLWFGGPEGLDVVEPWREEQEPSLARVAIAGLRLPTAWDKSTGSGVVVAVIGATVAFSLRFPPKTPPAG